MFIRTYFLGINHENINHTSRYLNIPVNKNEQKWMEYWQPSWIYPFPGAKSHKWPQKWILWPKFSNSRGITLEYTPKIDDFITCPVFIMAADTILNNLSSPVINSGYHIRKCSLGPTLQESTIKKLKELFWVSPRFTCTITLKISITINSRMAL